MWRCGRCYGDAGTRVKGWSEAEDVDKRAGDGRLQAADAEVQRWEASGMKDGEVRFNEVNGGAVHEAFNMGEGRWRNIIVELKD